MIAARYPLHVLLSIAATCITFSILCGSIPVTDPLFYEVTLRLRLPHTLTAFVTGGLLALAGALMQALVRNPLADPYVLGVSGGASVMTLLCMLLGLSGVWLIVGAWIGSLLTLLLLFFLAKQNFCWNISRLLLTGIALTSGMSALVSFILCISPDHALRGMLFWLMGDLNVARFPLFESLLLVLGVFFGKKIATELNILVQGENAAKALGVSVSQLQWKLYLLSSLLTATAVTLAGGVGFVGLVVPHLFRLLVGYDHRLLLPGCVLLGGSLLTVADSFSRTFFSPIVLPIGVITAFIGVPIFLILLAKNEKSIKY